MADHPTRSLETPAPRRRAPGARIEVASGRRAGRALTVANGARARIGSREDCELCLDDDTVSRQHLEVRCSDDGVALIDLGSKNGSWFGGSQFKQIVVRPPATLRIGRVELRVTALTDAPVPSFGALVGVSASMRAAFDLMARVAATDLSVLLRGETGTGKELAARAIHDASPRAARPYAVVDLAALAPSMLESELFGHTRGAFTGAADERAGAFELARDGSVFLDEIGELELAAQPRLLRVLETGEVKRVGGNAYTRISARIIAATNRELAAEIEAGRFRADLYHRLAGIVIELPPLRDRPEDLPVLVDHIAARMPAAMPPLQVPPATLEAMARYDWPGNVRQLRKVLERAALLANGGPITPELLGVDEAPTAPAASAAPPASAAPHRAPAALAPFKEAKQRLVDAWEREYVAELVTASGGNVTRAAQIAGLARVHLHRLLKKHDVQT